MKKTVLPNAGIVSIPRDSADRGQFIKRALASREHARRTNLYIAADVVIARLAHMLAQKKADH